MSQFTTQETKVLCILNPTAGGGKMAPKICTELRAVFQKARIRYDIVSTQKKGDGTRFSSNAVQEGYPLVVAIGGDGTVNEVATGLVGSSTTLGIIPGGSGNGLARGLRIPLDYRQACALLVEGQNKKIDVGQVSGRYFFATSGIGFDAYLGKHYDEQVHHSRGVWPYFKFAISRFFAYQPQEIQLQCAGKIWSDTPFVATVANVEQYGGGAIIAPEALPDDGVFDVSLISCVSVLKALYYLPRLFTGKIHTVPQFTGYKTDALTIVRSEAGPVHVDGEPFLADRVLRYVLHPLALQVRVC